ncbi:MAG: hypothetical protein IK026_02885 [Eubacteriaceae bacterium]|nr:hypothetical protein [Eubacteriaceae bacterium]MBR5995511.1 hypothetical protein [Eubacteriaceae bacterium]
MQEHDESKKLKENLFKAVLQLRTEEEAAKFFDDICTIGEIDSLSQRLEVARLLKEGKTYIEIVDLVGASSTTISRVNRCLNFGPGGYRIVLERMEDKDNN